MPRGSKLTRVESLERKAKEIHEQRKAARREAARRLRADDERRKAVLGSALLADLADDPDRLAELIRAVIPKHIRAKADLALFAQWLETPAADATEPG